VIYYWRSSRGIFYLITAYGKNTKDDMSTEERKVFANLLDVIKQGE